MSEIARPHDIALGIRPLATLASPREAVSQFTPNWFAATMGTGILALAQAQFPAHMSRPACACRGALAVQHRPVRRAFTLIYAARWIVYFDGARRIFTHPVMSMFFGCIPMGLATIINGFLVFGIPHWGQSAVLIAEGLWWIDVAMSLACGIVIPFIMFTRQSHAIDQMTAVWLLPVVAAEVAAVSGGLLAPNLTNAHQQLGVLIASYALWACSVPLALSLLVILILRMVVHKLPPAGMAASSWLALGPIGTGALGLLVLGGAAPTIFAANGLGDYGATARGIGLVGGVMLWGYGFWWAVMASLITARYLRHGLPFNLGWWGFTFPIGVYALATLKLAAVLHLAAFAAFGAGLVILLAGLWLMVGARTVRGAWRGDLFVAPCLESGQ